MTCLFLILEGVLMQILIISRVKFHCIHSARPLGLARDDACMFCLFASLRKAEYRGEKLRGIASKEFSCNDVFIINPKE